MLSHRELCDSKLSALHPLDNMAWISHKNAYLSLKMIFKKCKS